MKSDHRHELKTNELADWMAHLPEWASKNRTSLVAAGAVVLVALLVYFWSLYRRDVVSPRQQTLLTRLVSEVPQQMNRVASAAMQGRDESFVLLQTQQDLQDFAQKASNNDMAALALIQRGVAIRAELHYRSGDIARDEFQTQIGKAQASYQQALERKPSSPSLVAAAKYGLALCEEEIGNFDKAAEIYRELAQKPDYAGTTAQAAAAYRLTIMDDYKTELVFPPAPPKPAEPPAPTVQIQPGQAGAPMIGPVAPAPKDPNAGAAAPGGASTTNVAPTPVPQGPSSAPAPAGTPSTSDTNAPKSN